MKQLIEFSVNRAITVFMAVLIVIIFGVVSLTNLTTDLFPSINVPYAVVLTTYPGASPTEVEEVVTDPLEETLATTTNIKELQSISQENVSVIILEFNASTDMDSAVIEMRENLDFISSNFPEMVGNPTIIKLNPDLVPIMQLSVTKEGYSQQELTTYVNEEVLPLIERVPGVASVSVSGAYESEIRVVLDEPAIDAINAQLEPLFAAAGIDEEDMMLLDKDLISLFLMAQNFEYPTGYANVDGITYLVRVGDKFDSIEDVREMKVFNFPGNAFVDPIVLTIDDIASVEFVNANDKEYSKVNGEDAISFSIQKNSEFATTDVTNEVSAVLSALSDADGDLEFTILLDQGEYINESIGTVTYNLLIGAGLAILVLLLFLRSARATTIVALAIPISLMFAIVLIYFSGITLNIVSMGGLALGIGMLVDNSIVVIENIFRMKKLGYSRRDAALAGTQQVAAAITASTITTISVFLPVMFIEGFVREIFLQMALTIAFSLSASLVIALTLVPAISSKILSETTAEDQVNKASERYKDVYETILRFAMKWKSAVLVGVLVLFVGSILIAVSNGIIYFPESDEGQISISISNPPDDPLRYDEFVEVLDGLTTDLMEHPDVEVVGVSLGSMQGMLFGIAGSNNATANVVLKDDRNMTTLEIQNEFEGLLLENYPEIDFSISGSQQQTDILTGSGIQVELLGFDLDTLKTEAEAIAALLRTVEGIESVDSGVGVPADEIKITVDKDAAIQYGLTTAQVLQIVAEQLAPEDVTTSITVSGSIYDVYVYDSDSNYSDTQYTIAQLENLIIGQNMLNPIELIRLRDIAVVETVEGFSSIFHVNGVRSIVVDATYEEDANTSAVARDVADILSDYEMPEGYEFTILGENEEVMDAINTMILAVSLGIVLIYMVMASQFQSLTYPFIIMITIPLAFTGGFLILFLTGNPVSVVAAVGFVVLVGVVVNNGIVLVDYINQLRDQGYEVEAAIIEAGRTRLRPIVMTALTTILALITMAIGFGDGAEIIQPMAVTTIGGLLYATMLTLLVVPIMYSLLTKYGRHIFGGFGVFVTLSATIALQYFFGFWYIIPSGVVLLILIVLAWIFVPNNQEEANV